MNNEIRDHKNEAMRLLALAVLRAATAEADATESFNIHPEDWVSEMVRADRECDVLRRLYNSGAVYAPRVIADMNRRLEKPVLTGAVVKEDPLDEPEGIDEAIAQRDLRKFLATASPEALKWIETDPTLDPREELGREIARYKLAIGRLQGRSGPPANRGAYGIGGIDPALA